METTTTATTYHRDCSRFIKTTNCRCDATSAYLRIDADVCGAAEAEAEAAAEAEADRCSMLMICSLDVLDGLSVFLHFSVLAGLYVICIQAQRARECVRVSVCKAPSSHFCCTDILLFDFIIIIV